MIVWIADYPHNGSTLCRQILKDSFGAQTFSRYVETELDTLFPGTQAFHGKVANDAQSAYRYMREHPDVFFIKTHELPDDDSPAIFLIRDGRDAIASLSHFYWIPMSFAITGQACRFGSWSHYWHAWDPENRPQTQVMRYCDMVTDPNGLVLPALEAFLQMLPVKPYVDDFAEKQKQYPYLFNDRIGAWKQSMTDRDLSLFDKCHGELNRRLGYEQ